MTNDQVIRELVAALSTCHDQLERLVSMVSNENAMRDDAYEPGVTNAIEGAHHATEGAHHASAMAWAWLNGEYDAR